MALENGYHFAAQALPTPTDTPYETPSRGISRQPSRQGSSSPFSNYSPAPFPPGENSYFPKQHGVVDTGEDERFNARDPRRLTPNLGISFVSQIHSLKKELESKGATVGNLEDSLYQSRTEKERINEDLIIQKAEVKNVKHQMSSLEQDMLQALEDIAKERDKALENVGESRKLLEASQKKVRLQEEDVNKTLLLWEKDKDEWDDSRKKLEGKVHIVEERLKTMVAEMVAVHETGQAHPQDCHDEDEGMRETWFIRGNDIRAGASSRLSNRSIDDAHEARETARFRASRMSGLHQMGGSNISGLSLADELSMGESDGEDAEVVDYDIHSPDALPEEVHMASRRYSEDKKARKVMGLHADNTEQPLGDGDLSQQTVGTAEDYVHLPRKHPTSYIDSATQFTPPSSPGLPTKPIESSSEKVVEQTEQTANQSRKRVAIPSIIVEPTSARYEGPNTASMVSSSCQTQLEYPCSSLFANGTSKEAVLPIIASADEMRSTSTQTMEDINLSSGSAKTRLSPALDVPIIAIHPPASRPPSSHNSVVLPPRTRNAGCQVAIEVPKNLKSTSMQTEEIRIDKRPLRIPPRLQPIAAPGKASSRISERRTRATRPPALELKRNVPSPSPVSTEPTQASPPDIPRRNPRHHAPHRAIEQVAKPSFPQNQYLHQETHEDEQLDGKYMGSQNDFSDDDEFVTAAPIRKTLSKVQNSWKLVPQPKNTGLGQLDPTLLETEDREPADLPKITESKAKGPKQSTSRTFQTKAGQSYRNPPSAARPGDIRRQALVSNGIAEHAQRARSPSVPNDASGKEPVTVPPPFPVPTRSSSRKLPISVSEGAASPTPYSTTFFTARRGLEHGKPLAKRKILRKVQSAATVARSGEPRRPLPTPSMSASSTVPGTPKILPPAQNQFIIPYESVPQMPHSVAAVSQPRPHAGEASIEAPSQQTSVVDAIAQTMVGEWMWKYVRKRTSFGITDSPQAEFEMGRNGDSGNSSGVRHKRWVWLAPYENAVIWSSKQPTSGPALLGKGGRKLMIQSVLDVKDDTPLPKNAGPQSAFDRSILILTPQRALKFTAASRERHHIWLTALSFLSHSTRAMDDLASPPPVPQQAYKPPSKDSTPTFRRTPVRDSIRIAKARSRPTLGGHSFSSPIGELEHKMIHSKRMSWEDGEALSEDAAEPPQIPRVAAHARKRSSTGPRPVPLGAFHSYPSNSTAMASSFSLQSPTSRDKYDRFAPGPCGVKGAVPSSNHATMTRRTTDITRDSYIAPPPIVPDNFFDPVGTMRMEAFVMDRNENALTELSKTEPAKTRTESRSYRTRQGRKKDMSYWGVGDSAGNDLAGDARVREEDLFTGF